MVTNSSQANQNRHLHLPTQPTPFIGRETELGDITERLTDPACHLLTLVGVGGIGKTRLAIQVATEGQANFIDGVCFVPLQPIQSSESLPAAIADALQFTLTGQESPFTQLCAYLCDREILLVLDNFEHLLSEASVGLVSELLTATPGSKVLVSSREALSLREEWLYPIEGLPFPILTEKAKPEEYASVELFVERARQVRHDFSLDEDPLAVSQICHLVAGMPLALELAAAWAKTLTCAEIVAEIQQGLDFLSTNLRNMPERHRSIQTIFDHTWQRLSEKEQTVFAHLSVFHGSFDRAAATAVAEATLPLLSALLDHSLLHWEPATESGQVGRYQIHELLRQYGAEKLTKPTTDLAHIQDLHCIYYADFLNERSLQLAGGRQLDAAAEVEADLKNIRAAWQWAVQHNKLAEIQKAARPLATFYQFQSRYTEALNTFETAATHLLNQTQESQPNLALTEVLMVQSWFYLRFGRLDEAETALDQLQASYDQLEVGPIFGYVTQPEVMLGFLALVRGNFSEVLQLAQQALAAIDRHPHLSNQEFAYFLMAQATLAQGQYDTAQEFAQRSYDINQSSGNQWFRAYTLNTLGNIALATKNYSLAQQYFEVSYTIRQEFNDAEGMALALNHLGDIALYQADYKKAQRLFEQSLPLYQTINDTGGLATSYQGLGSASLAQNDYAIARRHFHQALRHAAEINYLSLILTLLVGIGELLCLGGQAARGLTLFVLVQHHPATNPDTKTKAKKLLDRFNRQSLVQPGKQLQPEDLPATVQTLLIDLPHLELSSAVSTSTVESNQALIEPLTSRELDVLGLLADGLSNQEIADHLMIAKGTVKYYTNQIYGKLQVRNRNRAVILAQELKLI